ncbi:MAG TPA: WD40 repeat domain-containing protein, partial [Aggregatilineales bacterium]|nr:WD40 repeat domain-containing protein [Aggregatilineales bacterium]
ISGIAFQKDGTLLVSALEGESGEKVRLWALTGQGSTLQAHDVRLFEPHTTNIRHTEFNADASRLAVGGGTPESSHADLSQVDWRVEIWDLSQPTGDPICSFKVGSWVITDLAFSQAGDRVAYGEAGLYLNDLTGATLAKFANAKYPVFSPSGGRLAFANSQSSVSPDSISVYDIAWRRTVNLTGVSQSVDQLTFSPDGALLLSIEHDDSGAETIHVWDVASQTLKMPAISWSSADEVISLSPDDRWLVTNHYDLLQVWDLRTGKSLTIPPFKDVIFSPNGQWLALETKVRSLQVWNLASYSPQPVVVPLYAYESAAFSPDSGLLALSDGKLIHLFDTLTWAEQRTLVAAGLLTFDPTGNYLAVAGQDKVSLWEVRTGMQYGPFEVDFAQEHPQAAFSSDGRLMLYGRGARYTVYDVKVKHTLYDVAGRWLQVLSHHAALGAVQALLTDDDFDHTTLLIWEAATGQNRLTLEVKTDYFDAIMFSPDDSLITASHYIGPATWTWDAASGKLVYMIDGQRSQFYSPDGSLLITNDNRALYLWDTATWTNLSRLPIPYMLTFAARAIQNTRGTLLISAGADGVIRLWGVPG